MLRKIGAYTLMILGAIVSVVAITLTYHNGIYLVLVIGGSLAVIIGAIIDNGEFENE